MFPGIMLKPGLEKSEGLAPSARMATITAMVDFLASLLPLGVCPEHPGVQADVGQCFGQNLSPHLPV